MARHFSQRGNLREMFTHILRRAWNGKPFAAGGSVFGTVK
jgi:hypothetical protein